MSFDLVVFVAALPADLATAWPDELRQHGIDAQIELRQLAEVKGWHLADHRGVLPWRIKHIDPATLPPGPPLPVLPAPSWTESLVSDVDGAQLVAQLSVEGHSARDARVVERLRRARKVVSFRSPAGRDPLELRLQCFAAAALAEVTDGVLLDPQQDRYYVGSAAFDYARRESDAYARGA